MKRFALRRLAAFGASTFLLAGAPSARAQANRVFASARTGNDLNTCSNINTPCQTLQGAVDQVAAGGAVLILDSGGYGPVQISKAVTIEAPIGIEAFIHPPTGDAIGVAAGAGDVVVLRGLTLSGGPAAGIDFLSGSALHVEKCVIQGFRWGIFASFGSGVSLYDLFVEETIVRDCTDTGIVAGRGTVSVRATVERCHLVKNTRYGFDCEDNCTAVIRESLAAGNSVGINLSASATGTVGTLTVERCTADNNVNGGIQSATNNAAGTSATLSVSNSTVTGNGGLGAGLRQAGTAQLLSRVNNTVEGNALDTFGTIGTYSPQ